MTTKEGQADLRESTLPASAQVVVEQIEGDGTEALAMFEDFLRELAHIGRSYDLSTLDGLTVVNDIAKASADLDVGVELPEGDSFPRPSTTLPFAAPAPTMSCATASSSPTYSSAETSRQNCGPAL